MSPQEFDEAQKALGFLNTEMALDLGVSLSAVEKWRSGAIAVPSVVSQLMDFKVKEENGRKDNL